MIFENFKTKFVEYLTQGIPVHIPEKEVYMFYESLDNFVNGAPNCYQSHYLKGEEELFLYDNETDFLRVFYENNKINFRTTIDASDYLTTSQNFKKMGEAFLGVVLFLESKVPSEDSDSIPSKYHDMWYY